MNVAPAIAGALLAFVGAFAAVVASSQRRVAVDAASWLEDELGAAAGTAEAPNLGRAVRRAFRSGVAAIGRRSPAGMIDTVHDKLVHAGIANRITAEEFVATQALTVAGGVFAAIGWLTLRHPSPRLGIAGLVVIGAVALSVPQAWLNRQVQARHDGIFRGLPDALDLMVIAMEAGVGFDGAIQTVAEHLRGPLAEELLRTLAEMELGVPRREALQNLRERVDVPELSQVIVSLLQADALGMPVSRVLRVQAGEMRDKRRQWAREKAGKLPVKILLPLVLFIFPPVMVVVIGPAVPSIMKIF